MAIRKSKAPTHLRTVKGVKLLMASHPRVRQLKQEGEASLHGNKVWRSSFTLMDYFSRYPVPKRSKVLDVGCGWGPMSVFMASKYQCRVTAIDADKTMRGYVDLHAELNNVEVEFLCRRFEKLTAKDFKGVHTLIGTDICFWDKLAPILFTMIQKALRAGVKQIIIADPGRTSFWKLANKCEKHLEAGVVTRRITRPVTADTQLLIVTGLTPTPEFM